LPRALRKRAGTGAHKRVRAVLRDAQIRSGMDNRVHDDAAERMVGCGRLCRRHSPFLA